MILVLMVKMIAVTKTTVTMVIDGDHQSFMMTAVKMTMIIKMKMTIRKMMVMIIIMVKILVKMTVTMTVITLMVVT